MPVGATLTNPQKSQTAAGAQQQGKRIAFRRSTRHHFEPFYDISKALLAADQLQGQIYVPAYGFIRGVWVLAEATGGSGTTTSAVAAGDSPWNSLQIGFVDVNGAPVYGPFSGNQSMYFGFLAFKYGGYRFNGDGRFLKFSAIATSGNFTAMFYIPIEGRQHDGMGALTNLNAAASYQISLTISGGAKIYTTSPSPTLPTLRVRMWLDAWGQPPPHDLLGNMTTPTPPALNTTFFHSVATFPIAGAGQQTIRLTRLGQYLRNLIFVLYDAAATPVRSDANWPDPAEIWMDDIQVASIGQNLWRTFMASWFNLTPNGTQDLVGTLDTGVYVFPFTDDGAGNGLPGNEWGNAYLPTLQSTRLEIRGNFGAAGTLYVLTDDVAPAGDIFAYQTPGNG
jgi:hypothetical protein